MIAHARQTRLGRAVAGVTVMALLTTLCHPAAAAEKWDLYIYNAVSTVGAVRGLNRMIEAVEKETDGAVTIRLHLGGSLPINTTTITQAVSDGVVQMGDDGYFIGNVPIAGILRLPLLIRTVEEYKKAAAIMEPYVSKAFEKRGVLILGQYLYPFQVPFSRKELTKLGDIKGQKLRVTSPEQGEFVKRLGGVPVTLGAAEVPSALDRSVVDGVFTASTGGGNIWKDLLKYNYRIGVNYFNSVVIVNKDAFAKLPLGAQGKVRKAVTEAMPWITATMEAEEDDLTKTMAAGGMIVTAEKPEDVANAEKIFASYWDEWAKAKGPETTEALGKVRAALGR
jgi:TRAP-type C4-dicarboxylate transport system substrate-binding protein